MHCHKKNGNDNVCFKGKRNGNIYIIDLNNLANQNVKCLMSSSDNPWLWHRRLSHASMDTLESLCKDDLVRGLPKLKFVKDKVYEACQMEKQTKSSFKSKNMKTSSKPLDLIHMDLFGSTRVASLNGNHHTLVMVDDYSRFSWVKFLSQKNKVFKAFKNVVK